jgi:hypothetical protein
MCGTRQLNAEKNMCVRAEILMLKIYLRYCSDLNADTLCAVQQTD